MGNFGRVAVQRCHTVIFADLRFRFTEFVYLKKESAVCTGKASQKNKSMITFHEPIFFMAHCNQHGNTETTLTMKKSIMSTWYTRKDQICEVQ
jgi:hypothetical protein